MSQLIPSSSLFRFCVPCRRYRRPIGELGTLDLSDEYRLPYFGELDGETPYAVVRMAWTPTALIWHVSVTGKQGPPWSHENRPEESDGLHVWIDTRDTKQVQRGTRFCHRLAFLLPDPTVGSASPPAVQIWLERAMDHPTALREEDLRCAVQFRKNGYELRAAVRAAALTGLDQVAGARLGFFHIVKDRELGDQLWSLTEDYSQLEEDPSLWGTVELVDQAEETESNDA